jgi:chemotaxis regulatin CheY-phosphate phosphatase CheZ
MSDETFAAPTSNEQGLGPPSEADYDAICAAVMETVRGRWFLSEYGRRNRHADTELVLGAINRIETTLRGDRTPKSIDRFRDDLMDMARTIARTKTEVAAIRPMSNGNGKLADVTEDLDFIVLATEQATSSILAAAEQIQETAWAMREQGNDSRLCDELDARAIDIYAAVSLQDVAGQRTKKVVHAMRDLEGRINAMIEAWGAEPMNGAELADSLHSRLALPGSTLAHGQDEPDAATSGGAADDSAPSGVNDAALLAPAASNEESLEPKIEGRSEAAHTDEAVIEATQVEPEKAEVLTEPAPTEPTQAGLTVTAAPAPVGPVASTVPTPTASQDTETAEAPPEAIEPAHAPVNGTNGTHYRAAQTDIVVADPRTDAVDSDASVSELVASNGGAANGVTSDVVATDVSAVAADDHVNDAAAVTSAAAEQAEITSAAASDEPLSQATIVVAAEVSEDSGANEETADSSEREAAEISSSYSDVLPLIFPPLHEMEPEPAHAQADTPVVVLSEPGFRSDRADLLVVTPQNAWANTTIVDSMTTGTLDSVLVISDLVDDTATEPDDIAAVSDLYARHIERSNRPTARVAQARPAATEIPPEIVFDFGPLLPRAPGGDTAASPDLDNARAPAARDANNTPQQIQERVQGKAEAPTIFGAKQSRVSIDQDKVVSTAVVSRKTGGDVAAEAPRPSVLPISPTPPAANIPPPPPLLPQRTAAASTAPAPPPAIETPRTPIELHSADVVVLARPEAKPRVEPPLVAPAAMTEATFARVEDAKPVASPPPAKPVEPPPPAAKAPAPGGNVKVLRPTQAAQPVDPLAAIAALSDEEKIALFS